MKHTTPPNLAAELFGASPARRLLLLKAAWPAAVGSELARRSQVVALDGDLLRIRVPDAIWRKSLWRMRSDLLARLRRVAGSAAPHALGFVEGSVPPPEETPPRLPAVVEPPLPADLARAVDSIPFSSATSAPPAGTATPRCARRRVSVLPASRKRSVTSCSGHRMRWAAWVGVSFWK